MPLAPFAFTGRDHFYKQAGCILIAVMGNHVSYSHNCPEGGC